jgi:hypothetical protein
MVRLEVKDIYNTLLFLVSSGFLRIVSWMRIEKGSGGVDE